MKPFLLLQIRPEDVAVLNEYQGFLESSGLREIELLAIRINETGVPQIDLNDYSGLILGGGPYNAGDLEEHKTERQKAMETGLYTLLDEVVVKDFPFLGVCYGHSALVCHQAGVLSRKYGEKFGTASIVLSEEGQADRLLAGINTEFEAFVGHKESCEVLPPYATLLASSEACPVQMFRVKKNVYAAQFHPELDPKGLALRIEIYKHAGYFPPEEVETLSAHALKANVTEPEKIMRNFVSLYKN